MKKNPIFVISLVLALCNANAQSNAFINKSDYYIPSGNRSEKDTIGSPELLKDYCKGLVVNKFDSVINEINLYNYDKVNGNLLFTNDNRQYYSVDKQEIKSLTLFAPGKTFYFEKVLLINNADLFEVIQKSDNYSVYKLVKAIFRKPTYHTDGLTESGNKYSEYADENEYYIIDNKTNTAKKFEFKKHSIEEAVGRERTQAYFAMHKKALIDEMFIKNLVTYLSGK
jgi:hypothetical protein